jgi:hypothetical protein
MNKMSCNSRSKLNFAQCYKKIHTNAHTHTHIHKRHSQKNLLHHTQRAIWWNTGWCIYSLVSLPLWKWIFVTHPLTSAVSIFPGKLTPSPQYYRFLPFYPKCFLLFQSQYLLCIWDKSQSNPHNLWDVPATKEISLPGSVHRMALAVSVLSIWTPSLCWLSDSQPWVHCWPRDGKSPHSEVSPLRRGSLWSPWQQIFPTLGAKLLEMPFPSSDQRNTQESLSKAKRKVLLLQKGAATVW